MAYNPKSDRMIGLKQGRSDTARKAWPITGSATDLTMYTSALWIGTAGNVSVIPAGQDDDTVVTFVAHPVGYLQVQCRRVTACPANTIALSS